MLTMQSMPAIWGEGTFMTTRNDVMGELAHWSVWQSPSIVPENLAQALFEFDVAFQIDVCRTTCNDLYNQIRSTFERCPQILAWNNIGLDALARNMAHSITLDKKYTGAQK